MPFGPSLPASNSPIASAELRNQFKGAPRADPVALSPRAETSPQAAESPPPQSAPSTRVSQPLSSPERRSHSKIGRLPKDIRTLPLTSSRPQSLPGQSVGI